MSRFYGSLCIRLAELVNVT